jgi:hypothetical protein
VACEEGKQVSGRFFEKIRQKTSAPDTVLVPIPGTSGKNFFAELFYKKATAYFSLLGVITWNWD